MQPIQPSSASTLGVRRVSLPPDVIVLAVRWYLRFGLSYRDVEELLADRGVEVDHVTVHRWVQRFAPLLADAARFARHRVGGRWFVDETYVKVAGHWVYLYRAVDQHGQVIDVYASIRRDTEAARRFFQRARTTTGVTPTEVITDRAPTYPRVLEKPGGGRPRPAETAAAPDARDQDDDWAVCTGGGSSVRAEPAPLPLRDRRRCAHAPPTCRGVSRTGTGNLSAARTGTPLRMHRDRPTQQTPQCRGRLAPTQFLTGHARHAGSG